MNASVPADTVAMRYCTRCVMPATRPRITFDGDGVCNACRWSEEKNVAVDWRARGAELRDLAARHRARNPDRFDCIVPVSGGKDSSYVAHQMKEVAGLHPLTITVRPDLAFDIGNRNLERFIDSGFDHLRIAPNPRIAARIARTAFIEQGQPLMAWIIAVQTVVFRLTVLLDIPLVMFGEEGEVEYGGSTTLKHKPFYELDDSIKLYLSGNDPRRFVGQFTEQELYWWLYPSQEALARVRTEVAHWSYFENWNSYEHYLLAKDRYGLEETSARCIGTYNNFAQTDTSLYDLHCYLMYLKFGFGRCTQDAGIDIRRGALSRRQAVALVRRYDGEFPEELVDGYLRYFGLSRAEFDAVLDRHANRTLFEKIDGRWSPRFEVA